MTPRVRRSESITLPPGRHPTLLRYKDEKCYPIAVEVGRVEKVSPIYTKPESDDESELSESSLDSRSEQGSYNPNDSRDSSVYGSETFGR